MVTELNGYPDYDCIAISMILGENRNKEVEVTAVLDITNRILTICGLMTGTNRKYYSNTNYLIQDRVSIKGDVVVEVVATSTNISSDYTKTVIDSVCRSRGGKAYKTVPAERYDKDGFIVLSNSPDNGMRYCFDSPARWSIGILNEDVKSFRDTAVSPLLYFKNLKETTILSFSNGSFCRKMCQADTKSPIAKYLNRLLKHKMFSFPEGCENFMAADDVVKFIMAGFDIMTIDLPDDYQTTLY